MEYFWPILFVHLLLDYPLQGEFLGLGKVHYNFLLIVHCVMWTLGVGMALDYFQLLEPWMLAWLFFGHVTMDYIRCHYLSRWCVILFQTKRTPKYKAYFTKNSETWISDPLGLPLWIDQAFHILQIAVCFI